MSAANALGARETSLASDGELWWVLLSMRITGGRLRSRLLTAPRGDATRPTSDRVREALFSALGAAVPFDGLRVVDLYAGTGALSFEALSRGAAHATLVEASRAAADAIVANAKALGLAGQVRLLKTAVERAAFPENAPVDLVFADPPYADVTTGDAVRAVTLALGRLALSDAARLVLEHGKADEPPLFPGLSLVNTRRYGDTSLSFYDRE